MYECSMNVCCWFYEHWLWQWHNQSTEEGENLSIPLTFDQYKTLNLASLCGTSWNEVFPSQFLVHRYIPWCERTRLKRRKEKSLSSSVNVVLFILTKNKFIKYAYKLPKKSKINIFSMVPVTWKSVFYMPHASVNWNWMNSSALLCLTLRLFCAFFSSFLASSFLTSSTFSIFSTLSEVAACLSRKGGNCGTWKGNMVVTGLGSYLCCDKAKVNDAEILIDVLSWTGGDPLFDLWISGGQVASRQLSIFNIYFTW